MISRNLLLKYSKYCDVQIYTSLSFKKFQLHCKATKMKTFILFSLKNTKIKFTRIRYISTIYINFLHLNDHLGMARVDHSDLFFAAFTFERVISITLPTFCLNGHVYQQKKKTKRSFNLKMILTYCFKY